MTFPTRPGFSRLIGRVLFSARGYAPHYAEDLIDPVSGERVLLMADPHIRRSAYIYSLDSGKGGKKGVGFISVGVLASF